MKVVTLVVERVVSEVEGVNHGGGVLRQRRRHLLRKIPGDRAAKIQLDFPLGDLPTPPPTGRTGSGGRVPRAARGKQSGLQTGHFRSGLGSSRGPVRTDYCDLLVQTEQL